MPSYHEPEFQKHFEMHYAASGATFEALLPIYEFGFEMAHDSRFEGKLFHDVEPEIKSVYFERFPDTDWEKNWDALFFGWEQAGGAAGGFGFI